MFWVPGLPAYFLDDAAAGWPLMNTPIASRGLASGPDALAGKVGFRD